MNEYIRMIYAGLLLVISACFGKGKKKKTFGASLFSLPVPPLPPPTTYRGQLDVDQHGLGKGVLLLLLTAGLGLLCAVVCDLKGGGRRLKLIACVVHFYFSACS